RFEPQLKGAEIVGGDPSVRGGWEWAVDGCDAVVNLAGHNLFGQRWNPEIKRKIRDSRVYGTENTVLAVEAASVRPRVFVQGSAIGYYGPHGDEELTEDAPSGPDFLGVVCREWEEASEPASMLGCRLAIVRTGVVLGRGDGALGAMEPVFKWVPGGAAPVGNGGSLFRPATGRQWMSWIHQADIIGLFLLALDHPDASGPINATSPNPVRNVDFSRELARVLHRPFLPVGPPDSVLRLALGEVADAVTKGQRVLPAKALALGYDFQYPDLFRALENIYRPKTPGAKQTAAAPAIL
ncbi:MAG TPA: TIGR01777 family oxidoreductase, partial [Isosphaeraceae bacterium]|nr:TIGR01777 family oxidoreductase [Isosphaeraceae bacterium]